MAVTRKRKWILRIALALVVLLAALIAVALLFPQKLLCVDSGPVQAEVLIVLGGGLRDRADRAAELFKERAAPRIIVSGLGDDVNIRQLLVKAGVPENVIQLEGRSRTTKENAEFTIKILRQQNVQRAIIVTSWYHSRRALACFEHYAPDMKFYSRPSLFIPPRGNWAHSQMESRARLEYFKLAGYWICYGICPF
ncbi:MAG TPA: YdcF family protein [Candidatus Aquilonibacter sp.]|nr:YdcF family protein [Candidatus Aquilonibacter sp.]